MYCKRCGKELDNNTIYCPICGRKIDDINDALKSRGQDIKWEVGVGVIALVIIGIAIFYFNLAHETLYTINGISISEVPKIRTAGWSCLIVGIIPLVFVILSIYNKIKRR